MRERLTWLGDALRTQLWPLPVLGVLIGLALGVGLPHLDAGVDTDVSAAHSSWVFGGGPEAARTLLGTIASSLVTVTSLTFSLTVVTLQLASSQFSPRLLRTFTRDRFVHLTLALFLGTFVFSLAALRSVRDETTGSAAFVPRISVTLAFLLAVASVVGLILFLAHLAREIRVETMLRRVGEDARATVGQVLQDRDPATPGPEVPPSPSDAPVLLAGSSGFLVALDEARLVSVARRTDAVIDLDVYPGIALVAGTPIGRAWARGGSLGHEDLDQLRRSVDESLTVDFERTAIQDYALGLRQLVDVCVKALSPGINDPTTAVHALTRVSALLCELARKDLGPHLLEDDGHVRVVLHPPDFATLLELGVNQPRRYGATDPFVLAEILTLLRQVGWHAEDDAARSAVSEQLGRLRRSSGDQDFDPKEQERLDDLARAVEAAVEGRWDESGASSAGLA